VFGGAHADGALGPPAHREIREDFQGFAPVAAGEGGEGGLGAEGVVGGEVEGRVQRARAGDQFAGAAEVVFDLFAARDGALPEGLLAGAGALDGQQQRQGDLAFAEVVAGVLAQRLRRAAVVEGVVGQLEG